LDELLADARTCLDAGADIFMLETEEVAGMVAVDDAEGDASDRRLHVVLKKIDAANVLFEVPILTNIHEVLSVTGRFVDAVDLNVNLGKVDPYLVSMVKQQQRRGIGVHQR